MGADMLGYFLYVPTKKSGKILKNHLDKVRDCLSPNSVRFLKDLSKGKKSSKSKEVTPFQSLEKAGVDVDAYINDLGIEVIENDSAPDELDGEGTSVLIEAVKEDLQVLSQDIHWGFRDMASTGIKVNGCQVDVYFAGGMSWGDEPDGAGYDMLKRMNRLGVFDAFYRAIPWQK